jgi:hypothetical protein
MSITKQLDSLSSLQDQEVVEGKDPDPIATNAVTTELRNYLREMFAFLSRCGSKHWNIRFSHVTDL